MPLDPNYIIAPSLEQYYVDKDTGLPLANGVVTFYKDQARTVLKPIYTISGSPPNYTYVQLPNPVSLSATGTFQDANGNNIIPYYFPYDESGNIELYYITVYSAGNVLQFTREGWPNFTKPHSENKKGSNLINYVPNGQFFLHNNIPATTTTLAGQITQPTTVIAQGGWSFDRPEDSKATDFVLFPRFNVPTSNSTSNPRYAVRISTTLASSNDLFKDLRLTFKDVNKFANTTQTFSFTGQTNTSTNLSLTILLIKNYGTKGSPEESMVIKTVMIQNAPSIINQTIEFGNNIGKNIGPNDDDYLQVVIRLPLSFIFDVTFTDFILTPGTVALTQFPQTTSTQFVYRISGHMPPPNADGYDLYLPRIKTLEGERYDHSQIGQCVFQVRKDPLPGELRCDGMSYPYHGYSKEGIPYKRLGDILLESGSYPKFGTGTHFVSAKVIPTNLLTITTNIAGAATETSPGTSGFTVTTRVVGNNYDVIGFNFGTDYFYIKQTFIGAVTEPLIRTAGPYLNIITLRNEKSSIGVIYVQVTSADNGIAGKWFQFLNQKNNYGVWFTVDGKGTNPVPSTVTPIKIDLSASMDVNSRASFIAETLSGHQITTLVVTDASSITAGSYFQFSVHPSSQNYYVWYRKDNKGVDPSPGGIGVVVDILSTDLQAEVQTKTAVAINKFYVTVPDARNQFIRIWNDGGVNDPDVTKLRGFPYGQGQISSDRIGSLQLDQIYLQDHHDRGIFGAPDAHSSHNSHDIKDNEFNAPNNEDLRGSESRTNNLFLNMFIKY